MLIVIALFLFIYLGGSLGTKNRIDDIEGRLVNYEKRVERIDQRWQYQSAFNKAVNDSLKIIPENKPK